MVNKYYAVRVGREPGIYTTWNDAQTQINGYSGSIYKSFTTIEEAQNYMASSITKLKKPIKKYQEANQKHLIGDLDKQLSVDFIVGEKNQPSNYLINPKQEADIIISKIKTIQLTDYHLPHTITDSVFQNINPEGWTYHLGQYYIFTDGSFNTRTRKSGWAVYLGSNTNNIIQSMPEETTNNKCELLAIMTALECIIAHINHPLLINNKTITNINIVSDSQLCINIFTKWINDWRRKGWKLKTGGEPKNLLEIQIIDKLLTDIHTHTSNIKIEFIHQNSHTSGLEIIKQTENYKNKKQLLLWQGNYIVDYLAQQLTAKS